MRLRTLLTTAAVSLAVLGQIPANAQRAYSDLPYKYGHSIDVLYGDNFSPFKIDRAVNPTTCWASGGNFDIRYTTYLLPWVGVYAQVGMCRSHESATDYLGALNKADGETYLYKAYSINNYSATSKDRMLRNGYGPYVMLGAAFRYDIGRWSFRPRIGFGNGKYIARQFAYEKLIRDGYSEAPTIYYFSLYNESKDYLIDSKESECRSTNATILMASAQVTYTIRDHFYFSLEAGLRNSPTKLKIHEKVYTATSGYNPTNWPEAIYEASEKGKWTFDKNTYQDNYVSKRIGGSAYLQFGIGWNFGPDHSRIGW